MGPLRVVIGYALAAISAGAIVWGAAAAEPVPRFPRPPVETQTLQAEPEGPPVSESLIPPEITTKVTVSDPSEADLSHAPQGRIDVGRRQAKLTIVHTLSVDARQSSLLDGIRAHAQFPQQLASETNELFGPTTVLKGEELASTRRSPPETTTSGGVTKVSYSLVLLRQTGMGEPLTVRFQVPTRRPYLVDHRKISVESKEWVVVRTGGFVPDKETKEGVEVTINPNDIEITLAHRSHSLVDAAQNSDVSWSAALGVLTAIVLIVFLMRALGSDWWYRGLNRELAVGAGLCAAVAAIAIPLQQAEREASEAAAQALHSSAIVGYVALFVLLPAIALRHAVKLVPGPAPWNTTDLLVVTGSGMLIGVGMLTWSGIHHQLGMPTLLATATIAAAAAAGSAVAFGADLGDRAMVVRLALIAVGIALGTLALALWMRALMSGEAYPPDSTRLVLALAWSLIPIAGIAVATRQWSRVVVGMGFVAGLLVQGWPSEWLDANSWTRQIEDAFPVYPSLGAFPLDALYRGMLGLLLLSFILIVLRLRRLGDSPMALNSRAVQGTMMAALLVVYLTPREDALDVGVPLPSLAITSLIAWLGATWLITGPRLEFREPLTHAEHRDMIRDALHQRLLFQAKQELYRLGRGKLGAGEMTLEDFDNQRRDLNHALGEESHRPETAFATSAACSPWHNGVMAFTLTLALTLPFAALFGWPSGTDLSVFVFDARGLLALPVFGFLFGYFYPLLRGTQPMTKALYLMTAATATEISAYVTALFEPDIGAIDKFQVIAIVVGQTALACIGLGLYWEWRLMHLAGEPWGRVRNVRSVRSLATPLIAVVIAAGTTAATTVAGKTVDRILRGDSITTGQVQNPQGP
ncbi:MAG: hypothetical protein HOV86_28645 [Thermoactinospora sp.]|nr:hypothetical protein [Thermoactinospora sp.]